MSPLRRTWLAWSGGWELPTVLMAVGVIALLIVGALRISDRQPQGIPAPFILFLAIFPLGYRLRMLFQAEGLVLAPSHVAWLRRQFFLLILPLITAAIVALLLVRGVPLLWALACATCIAGTGTWIGFTGFASLLSVSALILGIVAVEQVRSEVYADPVAVIMLIASAIGVVVAWRRLGRRPIPILVRHRAPALERISDWFDGRMLERPQPRSAIGRQPGLADAARLGLSGLGCSWAMRVVGLLGMVVAGVFLSRAETLHPGDRMPTVLTLITVVVGIVVLGWVGAGHAGQGAVRAGLRDLLAGERLRPLSRRRGAAATLLMIIGNCLNSVLPMAAGLIMGLLLADLAQGREPAGSWLLAAYAVEATAGIVAGVLLLLLLPRAVAIAVVAGGGVLLLGAPICIILSGSDVAYPSFTLLAAVLPLPLLLLAWWRLAEAELP